jgi:hypothetical protein
MMNTIASSVLAFSAILACASVGAASDNDRAEQAARRQQDAAKTIVMYGGFVTFQDGSRCRPDTSLADHHAKSVKSVEIPEEELMIGAPKGLSIKDCLGQLKCFPKLQFLTLGHVDLDDGMLKDLKSLNQLQDLVIGSERITDAGLQHLKGANALQRLTLQGTRVTDEGVKILQQALPKCTIRVER